MAVNSSDQLVPFAAMKWLQEALPSCTSTAVEGGTHAFVYDRGGMEDVFAAAHKGVQDARVSTTQTQTATNGLEEGANGVPCSVFGRSLRSLLDGARVAGGARPRCFLSLPSAMDGASRLTDQGRQSLHVNRRVFVWSD